MTDISKLSLYTPTNINTVEQYGSLTVRFETNPEDLTIIADNSTDRVEHVLPLFSKLVAADKQSIPPYSKRFNTFSIKNKDQLCVYGLGIKLLCVFFNMEIAAQTEPSTGKVYIHTNMGKEEVCSFSTNIHTTTKLAVDHLVVLDFYIDNIISFSVSTSNNKLGVTLLSNTSVNII